MKLRMTSDSFQEKADLHIHTYYSDGLLSPQEVIKKVKAKGISTISITDHDAVAGIKEAIDSAGKEVKVIPGVELSSIYQDIDVHILGYYIEFEHAELIDYLAELQSFRENRARQMIDKLAKYGIKIEYDHVRNIAQQGAVGRPHIATAMKEKGYVASIDEAFYRFIGYHGPCYVPKKEIEPREAIRVIKEFKGVTVLAHPGIYEYRDLISRVIADGIDGIEVWHPEHSQSCSQRLFQLANENKLLVTGGSDCHGGIKNRQILIGEVAIDLCYIKALNARAGVE